MSFIDSELRLYRNSQKLTLYESFKPVISDYNKKIKQIHLLTSTHKLSFSRSTTGSRERNRLIPRDDGFSDTATQIERKRAAGTRSNNSSPEPADFVEFMRPNEMWEEMENAENREDAKKYLQIMNARQEYLKNPSSTSKNSPDSAEFHNPPFKAEPSKLVFTKFKVGQGQGYTIKTLTSLLIIQRQGFSQKNHVNNRTRCPATSRTFPPLKLSNIGLKKTKRNMLNQNLQFF